MIEKKNLNYKFYIPKIGTNIEESNKRKISTKRTS